MGWKEVPLPSDAESSAFIKEFAKKARFLVDESVGLAVAHLLRRSGWNVKYVGEVGLSGRADEDVLAYALRDDRVLLTHDQNYLDHRKFPEHRNPGIVVLAGSQGDEVALLESLQWTLSIVGEFREIWRRSKVEVGTDGHFTVTSREFDTGRMTTRRYRLVPNDGVMEWEHDS